ncbi:ABC transporter ATP-binding protein [Arenivirga flava]
MMGGGGPKGRIGSADADAQRARNAEAPRIPDLGRRIAGLFRPHRLALSGIIALVLAGAGLAVVPPLLTETVFDEALFPASGGPVLDLLLELVLLMIAIFVLTGLLSVAQTALTARVGNRVMGGLRVSLFRHLQSLELGFFTRTKTGVIQSRLQNDVGGVASVLTNTVSSVIGNAVTVVASLVAMLLLSWQLTLIAVVVMPLLALAQRRVGQVRARIATRTQESLSEMTAITQESLSVSGVLLAKSFNRQQAETARYSEANDRQVALQVQQAMSGQWFFAIVTIFLSAIPAIVYLVSGYLVTGDVAEISAGTIVAFTTVQARLLFPLLGLMRVALDLQTSGALFARIFEYLDLRPGIEQRADAVSLPEDGPLGVRFEQVSFRYPGPGADVLHGVDLTVEPGTFAAFVGPSGAGKSTIASLIPRFWDATGGRVVIGGADVRDLRQDSLVGAIGIVSQETYLFHASIADNLRYAKPDATDAELRAAARAASIHDTIASFPEGYDTVVGERGYRLSGGEQQRVAIARVLLKDPRILVLDEATSALDSVSERVVQAALDAAAHGRTTVAIAHRLSTVQHADIIFVVERGRIVERGTHGQLLAAGGLYARLHHEQAEA